VNKTIANFSFFLVTCHIIEQLSKTKPSEAAFKHESTITDTSLCPYFAKNGVPCFSHYFLIFCYNGCHFNGWFDQAMMR
jgi:hypothetical protein